MPRAEARSVKAETQGAPTVVVGDAPGEGVLQLIIAGLIARLESSPLMRRAPAQCTPEEQQHLIGTLSGLAELRAAESALGAVAGLDPALVEECWPELAALVAPPVPRAGRRTGQAGGSGVAGARAAVQVAEPVDAGASPAEPSPAEEEVAFAPEAPAPPVQASAPPAQVPAPPVQASAPPARPADPVSAVPQGGRDLGEAVRTVLRTDSRPWSASRIAARLQEVDPLATRQEVYDTLYHHADLFRKTGHGWELIAR